MRQGSISTDLAGSALDAAVRELFGLSWGRARELVRRGKIAVDGKTCLNPVVRVRAGSEVILDEAARRSTKNDLPEAALVHLDAHVVVVEKPAGINTVAFDPEGMGASIAHRAKKHEVASLDELVRAAVARKERRGGAPPTLGVVHRLDKETSGLVVFTRTWAAKKLLLQAFRAHTVHRRYLALVHGELRDMSIATNFVPDRGDGLRGSVEKRRGRKHAVGSEKTQHAVTHVEVVAHLPGKQAGQACSLVACRLETGRTHQIRIHLSEAGHPVVGDRVYTRDFIRDGGNPVPAPRLMLHAAELGFVHPATERDVLWKSDLPPDMDEVLTWLEK